MKPVLKQLLASAFAALLFISHAHPVAAQETSAAPTPALWKISDEDSEIYLFGTVHILNPNLRWRSAAVNQAFAASNIVYFEAPADNSNPAKAQQLIRRYGLNGQGVTLSSLMSTEGRTRFMQVLESFGVAASAPNYEPLRPWLVSLTLAAMQIQATGGDPNAGVERILSGEAAGRGMQVGYFETDEQQMKMLSSLSPEAEIYLLEDGLRQMQEDPGMINDLVNYWRAGDVAALEALLVSSFENQEEVYRKLLVNRNEDWARQIELILAGRGTVFIAVGAAHLAGEFSVQELLKRKGIVAARQ